MKCDHFLTILVHGYDKVKMEEFLQKEQNLIPAVSKP